MIPQVKLLTRALGTPGPAVPDSRLLREVAGGRPAAFQPLIERHWQPVRSYLGTCVGDPRTADRLAEEALAWAYRLALRQLGSTLPWRVEVLASARSSAIRLLLQEYGACALTPGFRRWAMAGGPRPLNTTRDRLTKSYRRLPPSQQTLLWHTAVECEDTDRVAAITGTRPAHVTAALGRALTALREEYTALYRRAVEQRPTCADTARTLSAAANATVAYVDPEGHLAGCALCQECRSDLFDLRGGLRRQLPVMLLGWWDESGYRRQLAETSPPRLPQLPQLPQDLLAQEKPHWW
ncbi:RNA polymerase sigma factor [Kitasatospora sp. NPDC050543]|uniref:RNA polymerase sigma factor n=1 Tax=Kitasatospora sp. NPDC050543 TaxID=3364054 RepID=UPI00378FEC28